MSFSSVKKIYAIFKIIPLLSISACIQAGDNLMRNRGHMMGYDYEGDFIWLILLVLIGIVVYFLFQGAKKNSGDVSIGIKTPLDILKRRYANGEIDKMEFDRMKKDLEQ